MDVIFKEFESNPKITEITDEDLRDIKIHIESETGKITMSWKNIEVLPSDERKSRCIR